MKSKPKPKLNLNRPPKGQPPPPSGSDGMPMFPPLSPPKRRPGGKQGR